MYHIVYRFKPGYNVDIREANSNKLNHPLSLLRNPLTWTVSYTKTFVVISHAWNQL